MPCRRRLHPTRLPAHLQYRSAALDDAAQQKLKDIVAGPHRSAAHGARDVYRHPLETLSFFGLHQQMRVVEIWPGSDAWYTEILAPFLRDQGVYVAASYDLESETSFDPAPSQEAFIAKLANDPDLYDRVVVTGVSQQKFDLGPENSADLVLFMRLVHVFAKNDAFVPLLQAIQRVLRPGGCLGIIEHRADPNAVIDPKGVNGYFNQDLCISLCEQEGFQLAESSEINANPKDKKDHPKGVWSLPPWMWGGDEDRDRYLEIGESDRMTLKFIKTKE